jgi:hypothetical protein
MLKPDIFSQKDTYNFIFFIKKTPGLSPPANYTDRLSDRRLSAKLVPTLADRGCRVVSATKPHGHLFLFFIFFMLSQNYILKKSPS